MTMGVAEGHWEAVRTREKGAGTTMLWVVAIRALVLVAGLITLLYWAQAPDPPLVWDEQSYLYILQNGYPPTLDHPNLPLVAFFPLFPLMAKVLTPLMLPHVALLVVANLCSLVGFVFLYLWVRELAGERVAVITSLLTATSVNAIFFSRALTEGPFFMFVTITLWLMQRNRLLAAAVVCGLATLLRPTGLALALTLSLYAIFRTVGKPWAGRLALGALIILIGSSGIAAYEAFLWNRFQQPGIYMKAQGNWNVADHQRIEKSAQIGARRYSPEFFLRQAATPQAWNRLFALAILLLTVVGFVRPGPVPRLLFVLPLAIFLLTVLPGKGVRISSVLRYESCAVPLFLLLGWWLAKLKRPVLLAGLLCASLVLQLFYAVLFCRAVWVG